jgi:putative membrane protein
VHLYSLQWQFLRLGSLVTPRFVMTEPDRPDPDSQHAGQVESASVDVRQQLAADQTLLAWIRTAIAMSALGFVVAKFNLFLRQVQGVSATSWGAARVIGLVLVAAAAFLLVLGLVQHRQVTALLADDGDPLDASRWPAVVAAVVSLLIVIAIGVYLATGVK